MQLKLYSAEVLVLLDLWQRPEVQSQVLLPAIASYQHRTIIQSNQMQDVDPCHSAVLHNISNLRQSLHSGLSEALLDKADAPVVENCCCNNSRTLLLLYRNFI
jgi:hypothetical protein